MLIFCFNYILGFNISFNDFKIKKILKVSYYCIVIVILLMILLLLELVLELFLFVFLFIFTFL